MKSPRLRQLFVDSFRLFPARVEEPPPLETDQTVRDAHFYVGIWLFLWQEKAQAEAKHHPGIEFIPLPWYRQKAVCQRVAQDVRQELLTHLGQRSPDYGMQDVVRVCDLVEEAIDRHATLEYGIYLAKVRRRTDDQQ